DLGRHEGRLGPTVAIAAVALPSAGCRIRSSPDAENLHAIPRKEELPLPLKEVQRPLLSERARIGLPLLPEILEIVLDHPVDALVEGQAEGASLVAGGVARPAIDDLLDRRVRRHGDRTERDAVLLRDPLHRI